MADVEGKRAARIIDRFAIIIASHWQDTEDYEKGRIESYQLADRIEGYADSMLDLARLLDLDMAAISRVAEEYMAEHEANFEDEEDEDG